MTHKNVASVLQSQTTNNIAGPWSSLSLSSNSGSERDMV